MIYPQLLSAGPGFRITGVCFGFYGLGLYRARPGIPAVAIAVLVIDPPFLVCAPGHHITRAGHPCPLASIAVEISVSVVRGPWPVMAVRSVMIGSGPIPSGSPTPVVTMMPVVATVPVSAAVVAEAERTPPPAQSEVPAVPGVVADVESPGGVAGIVVIR